MKNNSQELIKISLSNKAEISKKWDEKQALEKTIQSDQYNLSIEYRDKIHEVERQRDKKLEKLEAQKETQSEQYKKEIL